MDYLLDIFLKADEEHKIDFSYEQLIDKPSLGHTFLSVGSPAKEWAPIENTYIPPIFVVTLTPYKDIVKKALDMNLTRKDPIPAIVEYDEVKVPKLAFIVAQREPATPDALGYSLIKWEEYGDEDKRGQYPTIDMDTVRGLIERALQEFKRTHDYNIITPNMGCNEIWEDPEELKKVLQ